MRLFALAALLITCTLPAFADGSANEDWTLVRDRDGIKIWTMLEEGHVIETYRAETIINATPASIAEQITDVDLFESWAPDIREAHAIESDAPSARLSYVAYAMPFPVRDRDLAQSTKIETEDNNAIRIVMQAQPEAWPEHKRRVRVRQSRLEWHIKPLAEGAGSHVTCIGYADPEGGVPPFIINMLLVEGPYGTLKALRAQLED